MLTSSKDSVTFKLIKGGTLHVITEVKPQKTKGQFLLIQIEENVKMMKSMTKADMEILAEIDVWCTFDTKGNYVLKEDAPGTVREAYNTLLKKYPTQSDD